MDRAQLFSLIKKRKSFLCVGLDPVSDRFPATVRGDVLTFNRAIIDATRDYCVAYKPNSAFYESLGTDGLEILAETIEYIGPDHFIINDAKRGDIGNTSKQYARASFDILGADAVTVAPYMGKDSVQPFLDFPGKWVILLALTSNQGSSDFQFLETHRSSTNRDGEDGTSAGWDLANQPNEQTLLYQQVMATAATWGTPDQLMFVCGATHPEAFADLRKACPDHFFLVPGIGAQGGDLKAVCRFGMNDHCGLLVNSSRGIIYASQGDDFAQAAREAAKKIQREMEGALAMYLPE
ncbi:MAG: orotidine-5'-phosphate decarboxylase [Bacteroidota bacterium]